MAGALTLESLLGRALQGGRVGLGHAYLLVGEGAEWAAHAFVARLLCERERGCGACAPCRKLRHDSHPDVRRLRRSGKRIGIDRVRELHQDARYPPLEALRKVYVIEETEALSPEAANSLLKMLEEPPAYVVFLLLARTLNVWPTVLSRCQVLKLRPPSADELRERWRAQAQAEDEVARREAALRVFAGLREHAPRPHERLELAQALSKLDPEQLGCALQEALRWYRDVWLLAQARAQAQAPSLDLFNADRAEELRAQSASTDEDQARRAVEALEKALRALQGNANVQLLLESLLLQLP